MAVTTNKLPTYLTEEQMFAELREAGLPEDIIAGRTDAR